MNGYPNCIGANEGNVYMCKISHFFKKWSGMKIKQDKKIQHQQNKLIVEQITTINERPDLYKTKITDLSESVGGISGKVIKWNEIFNIINEMAFYGGFSKTPFIHTLMYNIINQNSKQC